MYVNFSFISELLVCLIFHQKGMLDTHWWEMQILKNQICIVLGNETVVGIEIQTLWCCLIFQGNVRKFQNFTRNRWNVTLLTPVSSLDFDMIKNCSYCLPVFYRWGSSMNCSTWMLLLEWRNLGWSTWK